MKSTAWIVLLAAALAGCKVHYEPGERPFPEINEFPGLQLPIHAAWKVAKIKDGDTLVVERVAPEGSGPLWGEADLRRAMGVPPWKPVGEGLFEVNLFGVRIPLLSDSFNNRSGQESAKTFLERFVLGKRVALQWTPVYGSALVYVQETEIEDGSRISSSSQVNLELIIQGLAMADKSQFRSGGTSKASNWKLGSEYRKFYSAQERAREAKLGMWRFHF
jgi:endonuclease YncB( thermonuclease family)